MAFVATASVQLAGLTRRAQFALELAKKIAQEFGLGYVGTEHLLLAILNEGTSVAAKALVELGADEMRTREVVDELVKNRMQETWVMGRLPGTPNYRDVISKASEISKGTGNWQVCSVHLLLALLKEKESMAYRALEKLGLTSAIVKEKLSKMI